MRMKANTSSVEDACSSPVWANTNKEFMDKKIKLSKSEKKYLCYAIKAAEMSSCTSRHGAVLVKNGNVLAIGVNAMKNDPLYVDPQKRNVVPPNVLIMDMMSVHAEEAVIRANKEEANNAVIYIARISAKGEPVLSKPCASCQKMLKEYGVKKAIWTIADDESEAEGLD